MRFYQLCIEQDPNDKHLYHEKASGLYHLKRNEEALHDINKALALDSEDVGSLSLKGR